MGTDKRARQKAARFAKAEAEAQQARRSGRLRTVVRVVVIVGLVGALAFAYTLMFGDDGDDDATDETETTDTTAAPSSDVQAAILETLTDPGDPAEPTCPEEDGSSSRTVNFSGPPPMCIDEARTYTATLQTSLGDIELELDTESAPQTVNNFVFLSRWHYYDGVAFHRIIPDFMIQTGDAIGPQPGQGGPGYNMGDSGDFEGEVPTEAPNYPQLSVAMANSGGPESEGSQFFIVSGDASHLDALHSRFGTVASGEDVVAAIAATGSDSGEPGELTVIESVTITES